MAVKVRCPTCEKVLNAPDAARGKAIKCPGCETKVKVPAGEAPVSEGKSAARKSSGKTPKKKIVDPDSSEFLARLDLDNIADTNQSMCPKCGAEIPEEATECPKCGVDPSTGQLTASARKRRSMKGPDPALFYKAAWSDSWAFTKDNFKIVYRTATYFILYGAIVGGCAYMVTSFCDTLPPKVFWGIIGVAAFLALPGWVWCLTIEAIRVTAAKKSNIKGLHFDIFQNIALGVKSILWTIVFCWFPFAVFMQPLAMVHMAMPVTIKGWMNFALVPTFFRNFAPIMYIWVIQFVTGLIPNFFFGIAAGIVFGAGLIEPLRAGKFALSVSEWVFFSLAIIVAILAQFAVGFVVVFNARVIGLFTYYFQNSLDLTTFIEEKVYVAKQVKLDRFGVPILTTSQKLGRVALVIGVLIAVSASGYFVYYTLSK